MNILLIEEDSDTRTYMADGLMARGHLVHQACDGTDGLKLVYAASYDAVVIDRQLSTIDGPRVLQQIRACQENAKVLMLTPLDNLDDSEGMETDADDYLVKPFVLTELIARLNVIIRRARIATCQNAGLLRLDDLELDLVNHRVRRSGRLIQLQPREWHLLEYLMRHSGSLVTRPMLLEHVWGYQAPCGTSLVETHISRLRRKIEQDFPGPRLLTTVRGGGYVLGAENSA